MLATHSLPQSNFAFKLNVLFLSVWVTVGQHFAGSKRIWLSLRIRTLKWKEWKGC